MSTNTAEQVAQALEAVASDRSYDSAENVTEAYLDAAKIARTFITEPVAELFTYEQMLYKLGRLEAMVNAVHLAHSPYSRSFDDRFCHRCDTPFPCETIEAMQKAGNLFKEGKS